MALHNGRSQEVTLHCCWPVVLALVLLLRFLGTSPEGSGGVFFKALPRFKHPKAHFFYVFFRFFLRYWQGYVRFQRS